MDVYALLVAGLVMAMFTLILAGFLYLSATAKPVEAPEEAGALADRYQEEYGIEGWARTGEVKFRESDPLPRKRD